MGLPFEGYVIVKDYISHLEYIRSCEDLWQKGMYVELHAYQHHVFMDWRFVEDEKWKEIHDALNGAGVESMQLKWDEMFGEQKEKEVVEELKVKKPRKKPVAKKSESEKKLVGSESKTVTKPAAKKLTAKEPVKKTKDVKPKVVAKKAVKKPVVKKTSPK